jgi:hypothetical protein
VKILNGLLYIIYPCLFQAIFNADIDIFLYALIQSTFSGIALITICRDIQRRGVLNISDIFIISNLIYFYISSIKYYEFQLYPDFESTNIYRLFSVLVGLLTIILIYNVKKRYSTVNIMVNKIDIKNNRIFILWIILCIFLVINIYSQFKFGMSSMYLEPETMKMILMDKTGTSAIEKIFDFFQENFIVFFAVLSILLTQKKSNYIILIVALVLALSYSIVLGSRYVIYLMVLTMAFTAISIKSLRPTVFGETILFSPLILALITSLVLFASGRIEILNLDDLRLQLSYRFDLTDFAITLFRGNDLIKFDSKLFMDAVYYSIPFLDFELKQRLMTGAYKDSLLVAGLNDSFDYTDTFFSMGVQLIGILGFIIWPIFYIILLEFMSKILKMIFSKSYIFIIFFIFPIIIRIEMDFNSLLAYFRVSVIYMILGVFFYCVFIDNNKLKRT